MAALGPARTMAEVAPNLTGLQGGHRSLITASVALGCFLKAQSVAMGCFLQLGWHKALLWTLLAASPGQSPDPSSCDLRALKPAEFFIPAAEYVQGFMVCLLPFAHPGLPAQQHSKPCLVKMHHFFRDELQPTRRREQHWNERCLRSARLF